MMLALLLSCTSINEKISIPESPEGLLYLYEHLQEDALTFGYTQGEWTEDYGDAAAFGSYFYSHAGLSNNNEQYLHRAREAKEYNHSVVEQANNDLTWMFAHLEEVFMTVQGLIEYTIVFEETETQDAIEAMLNRIDLFMNASGDYLDIQAGEFAADLYGPTAITAGLLLSYVQYASYQHNEYGADLLARAEEIAENLHDIAFDTDHYRFAPDNEKLYLYPNAIMLILLSQLYQQTHNEIYLERAKTIFEGIQPLYLSNLGCFRSPYSEEPEGAQTEEYSTLSSQNYLMIGLMTLYKETQDPMYLESIWGILHHIESRLYDEHEHKIVHHWIDGRPANPSDPSYFCSGCNLQTLFILWYLSQELNLSLH